ncbi:MAG: hypothetical protein KAU20_02380 [Nanoarchaeota archaeon]|nr:hypothetical protein [Nanoarchaeota archaeon]
MQQRIQRQSLQRVQKIKINFFFPDLKVADLTNKADSVMDLLVDFGIIKDDSWLVCPELHLSGELKRGSAGCEIFILT